MPPSPADAPGPARRLSPTVAAFVVGLPLAALILGLLHLSPLRKTAALRYVEHPVECVEVILFCFALGALGAKLWQTRAEARACRAGLLPAWDGQPVPAEEAKGLLASLRRQPAALRQTVLGRRAAAVLEFLGQRGTAVDLDDHLRALADADALAQEESYALTRFITWAIPILGFLGTVVGITGAIAGVTPEVLEQSLSHVTDGLSVAFDATALALGLTMVAMFCSFLVERREQGVLEAVDAYVDRELAHRFLREGRANGPLPDALLGAVEGLVRRQAEVWAEALREPQRLAAQSQADLQAAVEGALERTLEMHAQRLAALEKQSVEGMSHLLGQLAGLAEAVRETGQQQQAALARVAEAVAGQAAVLGRLQEGETNLVHLQAVLHQNLAALASASNFEQAVHSLTAAAHLLTARAAGQPGPARVQPGRAA